MKYRDLPSGAIFQFSPNPGERETAIKRKLEKNADAAGNLLKVLREGLFEDFTQIKLT